MLALTRPFALSGTPGAGTSCGFAIFSSFSNFLPHLPQNEQNAPHRLATTPPFFFSPPFLHPPSFTPHHARGFGDLGAPGIPGVEGAVDTPGTLGATGAPGTPGGIGAPRVPGAPKAPGKPGPSGLGNSAPHLTQAVSMDALAVPHSGHVLPAEAPAGLKHIVFPFG